MWEVETYTRKNGRNPTLDFLDSLPKEARLFIQKKIELLEEYGSELKRPHIAPLKNGKGVWELRIETFQGNYRFLFFFDGKKIVITHGFKKNRDVDYNREIGQALEFMQDHFEKKGRGS